MTSEEREKRDAHRQACRRYYNKKKKQTLKDAEKKVALNTQQPIYLVSIIQRLTNEGIAKGNYPWKTVGETVRGLLVKGLEKLRDDGDELLGDEWAGIETGEHLHKLGVQRRQAEMIVSRMTEEVSKLKGIGNDRLAIQAYAVVRENIHKMPPTGWRDWAIDKIKATFPDLEKIAAEGRVPGMKMFSKHQLHKREGDRRSKADRRKRRRA